MLTIQQCINLLQTGQADKAVVGFSQHLKKNAKDVDAHQLIGVGYIVLKEYKLAEKHLLKALKLQPGHLDAEYNLARLYTELKKHSKAKMALQHVLKNRPDWPQARFALGLAAVGLKDTKLARLSFKASLEVQPNNAEAWFNLGNIDYQDNLFEDACANYEKAVSIAPNYDDALVALGRTLENLGRIQESIDLLEKNPPELASADYYVQLASSYRLLGDKEKAHECALVAINKDEKNGDAYKAYYDSRKVESVDGLTMLVDALEQPGLTDEAKLSMHFAMSSGLESCGEYNKAIAHLDKANQLRRSFINYKTQDSLRLFDMHKKAYSQKNLDSMLGKVNNPKGNIFIVGMPRSGTSLIEQILASHSDVFGAGELPNLRRIWRTEGAASEAKFHTQLVNKGPDYWANVGQQYINDVEKIDHEEKWLTDKMPHNFLMLGYLATVLPNAKIIHCKRNPIANCLSIYKASFAGTHNYAYNQKELAEYHNLYEDLMDHWRQVLPGRFYEIKYEELTSNQEEETRKLLEYCELPWQEACLNFHNNKRAVKTASAYQVRQSMHTKSVDLWKRYGDGLKPLLGNLYIPEEYQD